MKAFTAASGVCDAALFKQNFVSHVKKLGAKYVITKAALAVMIVLFVGCGGSSSVESPANLTDNAVPALPAGPDTLTFRRGDLCLTSSGECYDIFGKTYLYSVEWDGGFYILLYDGAKNVAGSSGQANYYDGIELYSLKNQQLTYISNFFYESSIDSFFRSVADVDELVICASRECSLFKSDNSTNRFSTSEVGESLIVTGLQRSEASDGYLVLLKEAFPIERAGEVDSREYKAFSALLDKDFVLSSVKEISNAELLGEINLEVSRIEQQFFLRQDNLEGRVAWGQHYILDWYILLEKTGAISSNRRQLLDDNIEFYIRQNVKDILTSRRYSIDRRDALFLLHVSRYSQILASYSALEGRLANENSFEEARYALGLYLDLDDVDTIETVSPYYFSELREERTYLKFSENSVFWADGVNVPVNYASDYIIALIGKADVQNIEMAESLLATHFDLMWSPFAPSWLYWYGDGLRGWKGISINTNEYGGDKTGNAADVTYRSTDAMALLTWCEKFQGYSAKFDCEAVKEDVYDLILIGNLEPHLLRFFVDRDTKLNSVAQSRYSRLSYINDLRNLLFLG